MKNIKDYDLKELKEELANIGEKPFRAEQIFKWLYQEKVKSFDEMTNLSLELREKLKQNYTICNFKILRKQEAKDGTIKYLFDVLDENAIETVLMSYHHGYSICVSSQIGCKMGCKFCASTGINFVRSLTSGEIVEQILAVEQDTGVRISNVVFMGIGEPLNNYTNVINAIRIINNPLNSEILLTFPETLYPLIPKVLFLLSFQYLLNHTFRFSPQWQCFHLHQLCYHNAIENPTTLLDT